jgi:hypothetical protein
MGDSTMETQKDSENLIKEMGLEDHNFDCQFDYDAIQRQEAIDLAEVKNRVKTIV